MLKKGVKMSSLIKKLLGLVAILTILGACAHKSHMSECGCGRDGAKMSQEDKQSCEHHHDKNKKGGTEHDCEECRKAGSGS